MALFLFGVATGAGEILVRRSDCFSLPGCIWCFGDLPCTGVGGAVQERVVISSVAHCNFGAMEVRFAPTSACLRTRSAALHTQVVCYFHHFGCQRHVWLHISKIICYACLFYFDRYLWRWGKKMQYMVMHSKVPVEVGKWSHKQNCCVMVHKEIISTQIYPYPGTQRLYLHYVQGWFNLIWKMLERHMTN